MPDISYFLPLSILRSHSHSLFGLLWFCLPVGLVGYVLFHLLFKGPLLALLPAVVLNRLGEHTSKFQSLPSVSWTAVVVSLLCGAMTHLVWDAFTHEHATGVTALPMLQFHLFTVGTYDVYVYKILQHGSTVLGLALLTLWSWQWVMRAPTRTAPLPIVLSTTQRYVVMIVIVFGSIAVGVWAGIEGIGARTGMSALQAFVGKALFAGLPTVALTVFVYSISWHLWKLRGEGAD